MLSTIAHVPHEPVVPSTAALLDPETVLSACQAQWTRVGEAARSRWRAARMIEASYHPRRYLRVAYVLLADPETEPSRYWPEGQIVYLHSPARTPVSRRGDLITVDGCPVEIYRFPNDRRLRGLRLAAGRNHCERMWKEWAVAQGDGAELDTSSVQRLMVRYVPEQKWVVRLRASWKDGTSDEDVRRVAVRACPPSTCAVLAKRHRQLSANGDTGKRMFRIPKVVGESRNQGLLGVEWIRGSTLIETLRQLDPGSIMAEVSTRLRAFHSAELADLEPVSLEHLAQRVRFSSRDLGLAAPVLRSRIRKLRKRSLDALSGLDEVSGEATLHNDFHWNQVSIKKDRYALFDLDRMAKGDALIDVANLAAQLELLCRRPDVLVSHEESRGWRSAILQAWATQHPAPPDGRRLHLYGAAARWEVARGLLRHLRPGWESFAESCLEFIESDLRLAEQGDWL